MFHRICQMAAVSDCRLVVWKNQVHAKNNGVQFALLYLFCEQLMDIRSFLPNTITQKCPQMALAHVDSAFYPPWDGKTSTDQRAVMLCGWGVKAGMV